MKFYLRLLLLSTFIFYRCSQNNTTYISEYEINGMVCEMGCGASIKKAVMNATKVNSIDISFDKETSLGHLKIDYYGNDLTNEKLKDIIEEINNGQFQANLISTAERK